MFNVLLLLLFAKAAVTLCCFLSFLVWSARSQTSDGGRRLLFFVPGEKVLQILARLRHGTTDHVMGERKNSRRTQ